MSWEWEVGDCIAYRLASGRYLALVVISVQDHKTMGRYPSIAWANEVFPSLAEAQQARTLSLATHHWWLPDPRTGLGPGTLNRTYLYERVSAKKPLDRLTLLPFKHHIDLTGQKCPCGFMDWSDFDEYLAQRYPHLT